MALSSELLDQLVKATKPVKQKPTEATVYGTTVSQNGNLYVQIDGSDVLTPVASTVKMKSGERVMVQIKDHTAVVTGNLTTQSARSDDVDHIVDEIAEFEIVIADKVSTGELEAETARIEELIAGTITVEELEAETARIEELIAGKVSAEELDAELANIDKLIAGKVDADFIDANYATIEDLDATNARINNLSATYATIESLNATNAKIDNLDATYATISQLNAEKARIDTLEATSLTADSAVIKNLQADVADIDTLIFGSASGEVISTSFANAVIAQLGNAQIKSAMIESITAGKITAGDINTNKVRVVSEDGKLVISDETIQISDAARVRVQIGKDATGDYSINIWDTDGNLMFSEGGITDSAIKEAIIRNDMVSENANISASKLDISSLFEEINGSTETIKATRIYLDDKKQSLDVAFTSLTTDVTDLGETVSSQGTQLSVVQGQIASKVWLQDIESLETELDGRIDSLSTQYTALEQDMDSISATVARHATEIASKADNSTVTTVSNKVSNLELSLNGFKTTVSSTYATKNDVDTEFAELETRIEQTESSIKTNVSQINSLGTRMTAVEQTASGISSRVTATEEALNDLEVGGRNYLLKTGEGAKTYTFSGWQLYLLNATQGVYTFPASDELLSKMIPGQTFTLSANIQNTTDTNAVGLMLMVYTPDTDNGYRQYTTMNADGVSIAPGESGKAYVTATLNVGNVTSVAVALRHNTSATEASTVVIDSLKLELGNMVTDWTPAPEDVTSGIEAAQDAAGDASDKADNATNMATNAQTLIQQLSDCISMLVTDSTGASLMTQTENGWTFSTGNIENAIVGVRDDLDELVGQYGDTCKVVEILSDSVDALTDTLEYIHIGVYEDEPCIELGESDSDFKLLITNTRIMFRQGSSTPAYISNRSLHITKAVIEEEMAFGQFVWQIRANGNMGLVWKDEIVEEVSE